MITKSN